MMAKDMHPANALPLKHTVVEAAKALTRLDADRLENLAAYCEALLPGLTDVMEDEKAAHEMAIFSRVMQATSANLRVMHRLRELRTTRVVQGYTLAGATVSWEAEYGHD